MIGPAIGLVLLAFAGCDHTMPVIFLCIACGTNGALYSGYQVLTKYKTIIYKPCYTCKYSKRITLIVNNRFDIV
jgi:hypothetical protein